MQTHKTKNTLSLEIRQQMIALLNARLADTIDLVTHTKQAHWNVKGINFIALHMLFDQIHGEVDDYADLIAERLVSLGGTANGTAQLVVAASSLKCYPENILSGVNHVDALSNSLADYGDGIRIAIDLAASAGDANTSDLFTEISRGIDKSLWFVESHQVQ